MADKVVDNWLLLAEYDLATAQAMLQAKRLLYVGFMCQQAVEKILKACYVKSRGMTPIESVNLDPEIFPDLINHKEVLILCHKLQFIIQSDSCYHGIHGRDRLADF